MSNLQIRPIKDIALGIYDGPHATPKGADEGPIFLGIKNVTPRGTLDLSEIRHVSEEDYPKWIKRVVPWKNDIVFSYEATLHRYALIPDGFRGCLGRRMALIRPDQTKVNPRFLHYYFLTPAWRAVVKSNIISGATVDRIPLTRFPDFELHLPGLAIQQRIASILSAYDDLIENNRRRIQLLEQAARLIYKQWFVHLRFPGHEHVKVKDGVPEGWESKPLSELCTDIRESINPKDVSPDTAYIGLEHIPKRAVTLNEWGTASEVDSNKFKFAEGDILFGKIRPYFHKVGFALVDGIASSDAIVIRPSEDYLYYYVLFLLSSDEFVALASKTVREGSKMPRMDWKYLLRSQFKRPSPTLLSLFSDVVAPACNQLRNLALHNQQLAQARDLLLPRLMNGAVMV
ncbi:MAG: restriction endonuclease subunit S [Nitrospira sp.]|nr:restriction endonuclease subunit S [Nitrospira sp.]